ncbi:MAG TPA: DUF2304 domain-containing protein [Planctomycetota bacterium]|nr:DUF2304 domain-containing protein [Planctomycetota bacterium]
MLLESTKLVMMCGGVAAFLLTVYWVRSRNLREKYAIGWLSVATLLLVCGVFPQILSIAPEIGLNYPTFVMGGALGIIYIFCFSVSVSLTHQYRRNVRLTQELALMEERVRALERALGTKTSDNSTAPGA